MSREAVERVTARIYKHELKRTGRLPTGSAKHEMEQKARQTAERVERAKKR